MFRTCQPGEGWPRRSAGAQENRGGTADRTGAQANRDVTGNHKDEETKRMKSLKEIIADPNVLQSVLADGLREESMRYQ